MPLGLASAKGITSLRSDPLGLSNYKKEKVSFLWCAQLRGYAALGATRACRATATCAPVLRVERPCAV